MAEQRFDPDLRSPVAQLYYRWEELDVLAELVENQLDGTWGKMPTTEPMWGMFNSLRTSLREAQQCIRRDESIEEFMASDEFMSDG